MSVNKYTRKKNDNSGDHDIFAIILIIISAFLLLCCTMPVIFGIVSEILRNVILGLFGISSYVILSSIFAIGISLLLHRRLSVPASYVALIGGMGISLIFILHLITTMSVLDQPFGEYVASVYDMKVSAGGVIFGVIVYGIKSLVNMVEIAYIIFSLVFIACASAFGYLLYKRFSKGEKRPFIITQKKEIPYENKEEKPTRPLFTDDLPPQKVYKHAPTRLFVENIIPNTKEAVDDEEEYKMDKSSALRTLYESYNRDKNRTELDRKFTAKQASAELYASETLSSSILPQSTQAENDSLTKKPNKILHDDMPSIIIPKQKETEYYVHPNVIINNDEAVKGGIISASSTNFDEMEQPKKTVSFYGGTGNVDNKSFPSETGFGSFSSISERKQPAEEINNAPIFNLKFFEEHFKEEDENKNDVDLKAFYDNVEKSSATTENLSKTDNMHVGMFSTFSSASLSNTVDEKEQKPVKQEEIAPVLSNELLNKLFNEFEPQNDSKLQNESKPQSDSKPQNESKQFYEDEIFSNNKARSYVDDKADALQKVLNSLSDDIDDDINEDIDDEKFFENTLQESVGLVETTPNSEEDFVENAELEENNSGVLNNESIVINEEPIDLSERQTDFSDYNTGYFEVEKPVKQKEKREKKSKVLPGQVGIDQVVASDVDIAIPLAQKPYKYTPPPIELLSEVKNMAEVDIDDIEFKSREIERTLNDLKFPASVVNVVSGPTVTRFELQPQPGISLKKILNFDKDLEYTLACGSVRIEAPIAGKRAIGIEVANTSPSIVTLREVVDSKAFVNNKAGVPLAIGKDIGGEVIVKALESMPHLLVAGATGMGKSVCLNAIIMSLIYKLSPEDIRLILVDPKQVEFMPYRDLPHMLLRAPIVDVDYTINAFDWLIEEMERRFEIFNKVSASGYNVRQLKDYNETDLVKSGKAMKMPRIVMIVDELADLMTIRKKDIETRIRRLAAKSRAAGINLILATQRPSVDVITGTIKANIPSRIAFKVTSYTDSQTILDHKGAEALLGRGDLLYVGDAEPHRIQGAFVSNEEISAVMDFVKKNNETCFDEEIEKKVLYKKEADPELVATADDRDDADEKLFPEIMRLLIEKGSASTSFIQCRFRCGYGRATRIVENLEMRGWIGPSQGARPREVYMTRQQFEEIFSQDFDE